MKGSKNQAAPNEEEMALNLVSAVRVAFNKVRYGG